MIKSAAKPAAVLTTVELSADFEALFTDRISLELTDQILTDKLPALDFS